MPDWWTSLSEGSKIAIIVALIGLFGGLIAALLAARGSRKAAEVTTLPRKADIEPIDITVKEPENEPGSVMLDIKLRNAGGEVAYIKRVDLFITEGRYIPFCGHPSAVPLTYVYDVELPSKFAGDAITVYCNVSQAVPGNEVDRFGLNLGLRGYQLGHMMYRFRIRIHYNTSDSVESGPIIVMLSFPSSVVAATSFGFLDPDEMKCKEQAAKDMAYMLTLEGTRSDELVDLTTSAREWLARTKEMGLEDPG
jgi:hypothetical protein